MMKTNRLILYSSAALITASALAVQNNQVKADELNSKPVTYVDTEAGNRIIGHSSQDNAATPAGYYVKKIANTDHSTVAYLVREHFPVRNSTLPSYRIHTVNTESKLSNNSTHINSDNYHHLLSETNNRQSNTAQSVVKQSNTVSKIKYSTMQVQKQSSSVQFTPAKQPAINKTATNSSTSETNNSNNKFKQNTDKSSVSVAINSNMLSKQSKVSLKNRYVKLDKLAKQAPARTNLHLTDKLSHSNLVQHQLVKQTISANKSVKMKSNKNISTIKTDFNSVSAVKKKHTVTPVITELKSDPDIKQKDISTINFVLNLNSDENRLIKNNIADDMNTTDLKSDEVVINHNYPVKFKSGIKSEANKLNKVIRPITTDIKSDKDKKIKQDDQAMNRPDFKSEIDNKNNMLNQLSSVLNADEEETENILALPVTDIKPVELSILPVVDSNRNLFDEKILILKPDKRSIYRKRKTKKHSLNLKTAKRNRRGRKVDRKRLRGGQDQRAYKYSKKHRYYDMRNASVQKLLNIK